MKRIILLLILANFLNGSWIFEGNAKKGGYILAVNQDTGEKQKAYVISKENDVALCEIDEIGEVKVKVIEPKKKPRVIVYQSSPSERERARQAQYYQNFDNPYDHLTAYGPDGSEIGDQYGWNVSGFLKGMRETKRALREQDIERGYTTSNKATQQNRGEDSEYKYKSISGNKYKYDLSNPGDRYKYKMDYGARFSDRINKRLNPGASFDERAGQYGGGLKY